MHTGRGGANCHKLHTWLTGLAAPTWSRWFTNPRLKTLFEGCHNTETPGPSTVREFEHGGAAAVQRPWFRSFWVNEQKSGLHATMHGCPQNHIPVREAM